MTYLIDQREKPTQHIRVLETEVSHYFHKLYRRKFFIGSLTGCEGPLQYFFLDDILSR